MGKYADVNKLGEIKKIALIRGGPPEGMGRAARELIDYL